MIHRTLQETARMAGAEQVILPATCAADGAADSIYDSIYIEGVSTDSRTVQPGMLYVPLAGARADGHDFIEQVAAAGAAASLWKKDHLPYPDQIPLIVVDDPLGAMQQLAKSYLEQLAPLTIGITGSNGKTSTKDMSASVFAQAGKTQKTQGNHNNEIGLPLTILDFDEDIETAILEMGMENFGEIAFLCSLAPLDLAVIVSIGSAHMENLGDRNGIAKAKLEIAQGLKENGLLVWNADSPELQQLVPQLLSRAEPKTHEATNAETGYKSDEENQDGFGAASLKNLEEHRFVPETGRNIRTISFGQEGAVCRKPEVTYTENGIAFETPLMEGTVDVHAIGDYQADNALAALILGKEAGLSDEQIRNGLASVQLTRMRSALIPAGKARILDDTYKSNPESAMSALETLMKIPGKRHVAVLSDMLDLGETTHALHAAVGKKAKELGVDALYTWGELSEATSKAFEGRHFQDKKQLAQSLKPLMEEDAVILVKGSRAMKMDEIVSWLLEETK